MRTNVSGVTATAAQKATLAVAATFVLVGVLGFVPGITTDFDKMELAGHESGAELFGIFGVSVLHNAVHLLFGVAGILLARTWGGARAYLLGGGAIYLVLTVYGLVVDRDAEANFIPVNEADNWLHLVLGLGMVALGVLLGTRVEDRSIDRAP